MDYRLVDINRFIHFASSSDEEAKTFFAWFVHNIPYRIQCLEKAINTSKQAPDGGIKLDKSVESLATLSNWFSKVVRKQKPSDEFVKAYKEQMGIYAQNLNWILSSRTLSLCFDIGIYFGEVFISNNPTLRWHLLESKKNIDHHHPVILGFGNNLGHCNPYQLTYVFALKIAQKRHEEAGLLKLYKFWIQYI